MRTNLAEAIGRAIDVADPLVGNVVDERDLLAAADAALDALREPTPEMIEAARTAWLASAADYTRLSESLAAAFTAAIDRAKGGL